MKRLKEKNSVLLLRLPAICCALVMLCVVPLAVRNAFFDINRVKVDVVTRCVPPLAALSLIAFLFSARDFRAFRAAKGPAIALFCFAAACVVSSGRAGFSAQTLTGNAGRYCGLWFLLALSLSFFAILSGRLCGVVIIVLALCGGTAVSVLAVLNVSGVDPFGFYVGIRDGLQSHFLSTVGYINFVGGYLALLIPIAASVCAFGSGFVSMLGGVCTVLLAAGLCAARSDAPLLALWLSMLTLLALCGGSAKRMGRVLLLWAACFAVVPLVGALLPLSPYDAVYMGFFRVLAGHGVWLIACALLVGAGMLLIFRADSLRMPGRKKMTRAFACLLSLGAAALVGLCLYYTCIDRARSLGALEEFLRYNDAWASGRGTVYTRCIQALRDYSLPDWLFGRGTDTLWTVIKPYFTTPESLYYGKFTDAHNNILHYLLTTGICGAAAYVSFYALTLRQLWRMAGDDLILCGVLASLAGYSAIMLFSVAQPVMLSVYVPLAALALGRGIHLAQKEGITP